MKAHTRKKLILKGYFLWSQEFLQIQHNILIQNSKSNLRYQKISVSRKPPGSGEKLKKYDKLQLLFNFK